MDEYDLVKKSSLKFKGDKKHKKHKIRKEPESQEIEDSSSDIQDAAEHGDWWRAKAEVHVRGDVAVEFESGCYAKSLDNGRIVLGEAHPPGEGPDEDEIFTVVGGRINQISLKSGFDRYWAIDGKQRLMGLSEAIGQLESFEPVFEDDKTALCAENGCFLSVDYSSEFRQIVARSTKASSSEFITIRLPNKPRK